SKIVRAGETQPDDDDDDRTIAIARLDSKYALPSPSPSQVELEAAAGASWRRFMDHVFAAFRKRRGPFGGTGTGRQSDDEDDSDLGGDVSDSSSIDPAVPRSLAIFEDLFELMLSPDNAARHALV